MTAPRQTATLGATILRPFLRDTPRASLPITSQRFASQGYGSGAGDPKGENPQQQGTNPATADKEHPGPPPPAEGQGSGSTPTKGSSEGHSAGQSSSGGSPSGSKKATQGAQPKLNTDSPPPPGEASQDVKDHNKAFENRAEKGHEKVKDEDVEKDKVGKGFWAGQGGVDRQP